jgi:flavodoxin
MKPTEKTLFEIRGANEESLDQIASMINGEPIKRSIRELINLTGDTLSQEVVNLQEVPLYFERQNKKFIPNKVTTAISRHIPAAELREINPDKDIAIELCLIFISNLSNAFYHNQTGWKSLQASILREQVSTHTTNSVYKKIIKLMEKGTKRSGPIIEVDKLYSKGQYSRSYRMAETYRNKGVISYEFKTTYAKNLLTQSYFKRLNIALDSDIALRLIKLYSVIELPSEQDMIELGKSLVKQGYKTNKGKTLIMRNKRADSYWSDEERQGLSFIEDNIELFNRLTSNGYLIPTISETGRVTDSFNLMPSWIRILLKIRGEKISEADYSCLHPNLAATIYGGTEKYITHQKIADEVGADLIDVKVDHLSFFNKSAKGEMVIKNGKSKWIGAMNHSKVYDYYIRNEKKMIMNIVINKGKNGYSNTYKDMVGLEVKVMTSVMNRLDAEGIYVGYIYDAIFVAESDRPRAIEVMNEEVIKFGVYTKAK